MKKPCRDARSSAKGVRRGTADPCRSTLGEISVSDPKRLKELETEDAQLATPVAESLLENEVTH